MAEWAGVVLTAILTLAALYFGSSLRWKWRAEVDVNVAKQRFGAYAALWETTKTASPMRGAPLTPGERQELYDSLTDWYYDAGNGMLLAEETRNIYLKAKKNLTCSTEELVPGSLAIAVTQVGDRARGQASIDQLSLLRTSMRADLRIFTQPYDERLDDDDVAFLEACGIELSNAPWRDAVPRRSEHKDA